MAHAHHWEFNTAAELAQELNATTFPINLPNALAARAKAVGLVIMHPVTAHLTRFLGAIEGSHMLPPDAPLLVDAKGVVPELEDVATDISKDVHSHFLRKRLAAPIQPVWQPTEVFPAYYKTDFKHEVFEANFYGSPCCNAIIFSMNDVQRALLEKAVPIH